MKQISKKGNFGLLQTAAIAFVVITILLTIGSDITADVGADQCGIGELDGAQSVYNATIGRCENASNVIQGETISFNASHSGLEGMASLGDNLTTIATVVGAVILLGFLGVKLFGGR